MVVVVTARRRRLLVVRVVAEEDGRRVVVDEVQTEGAPESLHDWRRGQAMQARDQRRWTGLQED